MQYVLEIHVDGVIVHTENIPATDSAIDLFKEHVKMSEAGETLYLYVDNGNEVPMTLLYKEESPYN